MPATPTGSPGSLPANHVCYYLKCFSAHRKSVVSYLLVQFKPKAPFFYSAENTQKKPEAVSFKGKSDQRTGKGSLVYSVGMCQPSSGNTNNDEVFKAVAERSSARREVMDIS